MGATHQSLSGSRTVLELAGLTLLTFVIALVAGVVFIVPLVALGYDIQSTPILVGATAVSQLCMFGVGYLYYRYRDLTVPVALPSLRQLGYVAGGVVAALAAAVVLSMLLTSLGLVPGSVIGETAATNPTNLLGLAALSIVVVAPVEEFVFRGVVQGRLRDRFGPVPAIAGVGGHSNRQFRAIGCRRGHSLRADVWWTARIHVTLSHTKTALYPRPKGRGFSACVQ